MKQKFDTYGRIELHAYPFALEERLQKITLEHRMLLRHAELIQNAGKDTTVAVEHENGSVEFGKSLGYVESAHIERYPFGMSLQIPVQDHVRISQNRICKAAHGEIDIYPMDRVTLMANKMKAMLNGFDFDLNRYLNGNE